MASRTNVFSYVLDALNYQGIALVAWVAIALAHMAYLRREHADLDRMEFRPGRIPAFNPGGIVAWVVATAIGVTLKMTDTATSQCFDATGPAFHAAAREEALEYGRRGRQPSQVA